MNNIDMQQAVKDIAKGKAKLLDVRTKAEYKHGHAEHAQHLELTHLVGGKKPNANKDEVIYVYCHSGARAGLAAANLKLRGYTKVKNIGGLSGWKEAGGKIEK